MTMRLTAAALQEMRAHLENVYPYEGCGIMLGTRDTVTMIHKGNNIREDRQEDRFLLNPSDIMQAEKIAKEKGIDILGFYHSHPDHPALPSSTDLESAWEGYYYLISSVEKGTMGETGVFRLSEQSKDFVRELFSIED